MQTLEGTCLYNAITQPEGRLAPEAADLGAPVGGRSMGLYLTASRTRSVPLRVLPPRAMAPGFLGLTLNKLPPQGPPV